MKFHRFPHLVQRELCGLLTPLDLLLLSFCSDRTRKAVRKAIGKQKNEIWVSGNRWLMTVLYRNKNRFDRMCYVQSERRPVPRRVICIEIDGVDVGISWTMKARHPCSIDVHNESHISLMHKYICNLFNASEEIYLKTDQLEYEFPSVKRSYLYSPLNSEFTIDQLGRFYRYYPEQEFSEVKCNVPFSYRYHRDNVFVVRNLIFRGTFPNVMECIRMFKGEHAYFEDTYMCGLEMIYISQKWKEQTDDGLKSMVFKPKRKCDVENVRRKIMKISCGKQRKQRIYPYNSLITQYQNFPSYTFDCTDGIDIRRDTDGKMATITVFPDYVTFFVWD